ncbi:S-layer homology domain-containing protein [Paenibacillus sp. M1]|uniref:S-layer homology domain-containing protein n=1 Tax=Paenibacillus haidiansis TaxID=1574488 RepID=A0ABU7VPN9_9BACL
MTGDGSADNPYVITTLKQLNDVRNDLSAHYILGADIDASETAAWNNGEGFVPIGINALGSGAYAFEGVLDGRGYVIRNLTIDWSGSESVGLFGTVGNNGVIRNVGLAGGTVKGSGTGTGGLVGYNQGTVDNSYSSAKVFGNHYTGGLVGFNDRTGEITDSYATGNVTASGYDAGGLTGENAGDIEFSYASGEVGGTYNVGGLAGNNAAGVINQSYAAGKVAGYSNIGGLIGTMHGGNLNDAYAIGDVNGSLGVGGLIGQTIDLGVIKNSYASGYVSGINFVGGVIGHNSSAYFLNIYWDADTTGQAAMCGSDPHSGCGGNGLTTSQALTQANYTGWDFSNVWYMAGGATRPFLRSEWSAEIANAHQLQLIALNLDADYKLAEDIDFGDTFVDGSSDMWATSGSSGGGFIPLGSTLNGWSSFTGSLDGQGRTITGLYINGNVYPGGNAGLFSSIYGEVSRLHLIDGQVTGGNRIGLLAGDNGTSGRIADVHASGEVTGGIFAAGGLIGYNVGSIGNSSWNGSVQGMSAVGGLVGWNNSGSVLNEVSAIGRVGGISDIGGLVGNNAGIINLSYADSNTSGTTIVGGLVGRNAAGAMVSQSFASGNITGSDSVGGLAGTNISNIFNSYATGSIQGSSNMGGLVGQNTGIIQNAYAVVTFSGGDEIGGLVGLNIGLVGASFYNTETTGKSDTGKGEPLSTAAMKQSAAYGSGWNWGGLWGIQEGKSYPFLQGIDAAAQPDIASPTVVDAMILGEHPDQIALTLDEEVEASGGSGLSVMAGGEAVPLTRVEGTGSKTLVLTLTQAMDPGRQTFLSYDNGVGSIADPAGNRLLGFENMPVEFIPDADTEPPTIEISMTKTDGSGYMDGEWTNQSVGVHVEAYDSGSVTSVTYSTDGEATWNPYFDDIVLNEDGTYHLAFKAVDAAGNEAAERRTVNISTSGILLTPTLVNADGSEYANGEWANASVTVSVYAKAGDLGIASFTYSLDGGDLQPYANREPIAISDDGVHNLRFEAEDEAGNTRSLEIAVNIDKTPPSVALNPDGRETASASAATAVTVSDTLSGPDASSLQYVWTTSGTAPTEGWAPFVNGSVLKIDNADGDWFVHVRALDRAGNESKVSSRRFRLSGQETNEPGGNESDRSSHSGGSRASGSVYPVGLEGRKIDFPGGRLIIPAGALNRQFNVNIDEFVGIGSLPFEDGERLIGKVIELKLDAAEKFDKAVTVHLFFDPESVRKENEELGLYRLDEEAKRWTRLDQVDVDWEQGMAGGKTVLFGKFAIIASGKAEEQHPELQTGSRFTDVQRHWAQNYIEKLADTGAVNGFQDGSFRPDHNISRAEFAAILVRALNLTDTEGKTFTDTKGHWAEEAIGAAYSHGIVKGYASGNFGPDDPITREQMAVMLVQALHLPDPASETSFADQDQIAGWARNSVMAAAGAGLLSGYPDNTFIPEAQATRAEAVAAIWRAVEDWKRL